MIMRRSHKSAFKKKRNYFNKETLPLYIQGRTFMRLPRGTFAFSFAFLFYKVKRILPRGAVVSHVRRLSKRLGCGTAQKDVSRKNREGVG